MDHLKKSLLIELQVRELLPVNISMNISTKLLLQEINIFIT